MECFDEFLRKFSKHSYENSSSKIFSEEFFGNSSSDFKEFLQEYYKVLFREFIHIFRFDSLSINHEYSRDFIGIFLQGFWNFSRGLIVNFFMDPSCSASFVVFSKEFSWNSMLIISKSSSGMFSE